MTAYAASARESYATGTADMHAESLLAMSNASERVSSNLAHAAAGMYAWEVAQFLLYDTRLLCTLLTSLRLQFVKPHRDDITGPQSPLQVTNLNSSLSSPPPPIQSEPSHSDRIPASYPPRSKTLPPSEPQAKSRSTVFLNFLAQSVFLALHVSTSVALVALLIILDAPELTSSSSLSAYNSLSAMMDMSMFAGGMSCKVWRAINLVAWISPLMSFAFSNLFISLRVSAVWIRPSRLLTPSLDEESAPSPGSCVPTAPFFASGSVLASCSAAGHPSGRAYSIHNSVTALIHLRILAAVIVLLHTIQYVLLSIGALRLAALSFSETGVCGYAPGPGPVTIAAQRGTDTDMDILTNRAAAMLPGLGIGKAFGNALKSKGLVLGICVYLAAIDILALVLIWFDVVKYPGPESVCRGSDGCSELACSSVNIKRTESAEGESVIDVDLGYDAASTKTSGKQLWVRTVTTTAGFASTSLSKFSALPTPQRAELRPAHRQVVPPRVSRLSISTEGGESTRIGTAHGLPGEAGPSAVRTSQTNARSDPCAKRDSFSSGLCSLRNSIPLSGLRPVEKDGKTISSSEELASDNEDRDASGTWLCEQVWGAGCQQGLPWMVTIVMMKIGMLTCVILNSSPDDAAAAIDFQTMCMCIPALVVTSIATNRLFLHITQCSPHGNGFMDRYPRLATHCWCPEHAMGLGMYTWHPSAHGALPSYVDRAQYVRRVNQEGHADVAVRTIGGTERLRAEDVTEEAKRKARRPQRRFWKRKKAKAKEKQKGKEKRGV